MYLIKTRLVKSALTIEFLKDQSNKPAVENFDPSTIKIVAKEEDMIYMTSFPLGTIFSVDHLNPGSIECTIEGSIRPMFNKGDTDIDVFFKGLKPENTPTNADLDYLIDTLLMSEGLEVAKKVCAKYVDAGVGYTLDADERFKSMVSTGRMTLLDKIKIDHPCPSAKDIGFHIQKDIWNLLIRLVKRRENILLIGPTGLKNQLLFA